MSNISFALTLILLQTVCLRNAIAQTISVKLIYNTNINPIPIVDNRTYHSTFFVDSTIYTNNVDYTSIDVDTFSIEDNVWRILKYGKWYTYLSLNSKQASFKYPCYLFNDHVIYCENKIRSKKILNGKKIIEFTLKVGEGQIFSSEDDVSKEILFDLDIGILKITQDDYIIKLSSLSFK